MGIHAINILYDFCIMSALLFVAKILRSKIKFIQKLYIPSFLLAGVIGLFLGNKKKVSFKICLPALEIHFW